MINVYNVLTDPAVGDSTGAIYVDETAREKARKRAFIAAGSLSASVLLCFAMFAGSDCDHMTDSGPPFYAIPLIPGIHEGLMILIVFASAAAAFYPIAIIQKSRPRFLHVAGCYLFVNAATLYATVMTTWAGCMHNHLIRMPSAILSIAGMAACFVLLQWSIKLKVEALEAAPELSACAGDMTTRCGGALFSRFGAVILVGVGLLSLTIALGLVQDYDWFWAILKIDGIFMTMAIVPFVAFTIAAVRSMIRCRNLLKDHVAFDPMMCKRLRRLLLVHAVGTAAANGSSILWILITIGTVTNIIHVEKLYHAFAVDNMCNTGCALVLSGLVEAVLWPVNARVTPNSNAPGDVMGELQLVGKMAQAAVVGRIGSNYKMLNTDDFNDRCTDHDDTFEDSFEGELVRYRSESRWGTPTLSAA
eukprot:gnl/TRDRNA2_/TRDRNA2_90107_c1_seq1.p1 gnl/TRDRNA2_/TRDRNA2_90107_c1~~gnl/TRDRNA2_/TRDRNA2_90107_c1_seq1.p1  ORF type:complete len:418 (+),score=50.92 gnl/TRDRNA2_/TRDRNA2_90107_c1_seq1:86-1339(+)